MRSIKNVSPEELSIVISRLILHKIVPKTVYLENVILRDNNNPMYVRSHSRYRESKLLGIKIEN